MKRIWFLVLLCLLLTGCWDRRELEEISIIAGLGIDKGNEEKYRLSVDVLNASELNPKTGGDNTASILFSLEGPTTSSLARKLNVKLSRKMIFSHVQTVVISEEIAKEGIIDFLDFLERSPEMRNDFNVVIAKGVSAEEILQISYPLQKVPSQKLNVQLNTMIEEWGGDPKVLLNDLIQALISKGREPVLATVSLIGSAEQGKATENMKLTTPNAYVKLENLAVFKGSKLQGFLSLKDARNYLWTQNEIKKTSLSIPCGDKKFLDVRVSNSTSDTHVTYKNEKPSVHLTLNVETFLEGTHCSSNQELSKIETYTQYEKWIEDHINNEVSQTIKVVQEEYGSDIFGFGEKLEKQDYKSFKKIEDQWNEKFKEADISIEVNARLRRAGIRTDSFLKDVE